MNKVMLIGNVGKEPDVRYYDNDQAVAAFPLATTERGYTLQNGTKVPDRTDWHNIVMYRGLAKIVERYVHKGDKLYVEGRIHYRSYDDKRGIKRTIVEVYAENMELLTPRQTAGQPDVVNTTQKMETLKPSGSSASAQAAALDSAALDDTPF